MTASSRRADQHTIREWKREGYLITTDKERLDPHVVHEFLITTYWAKDISVDNVKRRIEKSFTFGLYEGCKQVGFARVITDYIAYAYLADVFVEKSHRGQGLGKWLIEVVLSHPRLEDLAWHLATEDAHDLYRTYGFTELKEPEIHMERRAAQAHASS